MKKAVMIPGSFYSIQPAKPGARLKSDDMLEVTRLSRLLNDGWEIVSVFSNQGAGIEFGGDSSYLIILEKE